MTTTQYSTNSLNKTINNLKNPGIYALNSMLYNKNYNNITTGIEHLATPIMKLLGISKNKSQNITKEGLSNIIKRQLDILESQHYTPNSNLLHNLFNLVELLNLTETEIKIVYYLFLTQTNSTLINVVKECSIDDLNSFELQKYFAYVLSIPISEVRDALEYKSSLTEFKIVISSGFFASLKYELDDVFISALLSRQKNVINHFSKTFSKVPRSAARISDYHYLGINLKIMQELLAHAYENKQKGVNILLYGPPGVGKTSLVHALGKSLKSTIYQVSDCDINGEPFDRSMRMTAYNLCQQIIRNAERPLVLFDEIEDIFETSMFFNYGKKNKAWVNSRLENNPAPAIWISNDISGIERAHLRRFDFILEIKNPNQVYRSRFVSKTLAELPISPAIKQSLTENKDLSLGEVERIAKVTRRIISATALSADEIAQQIQQNNMKAFGKTMPSCQEPLNPAIPYNIDFLNTNTSPSALTQGLLKNKEGRLCFYGPPGTGKTEFATQLVKLSGLEIIKKTGSDIFDKFVGETEKNIAAAFNEAKEKNAVLVFDEVDSFLNSRSAENRSWENSKVNEMLTQMENYQGILICTTNRLDDLDAAVLRRFDAKIKFDYLKPDQVLQILQTTLKKYAVLVPEDEQFCQRLSRLKCLTPGDLAVAARKIRITGSGSNAYNWLEILEEECALKPVNKNTPIGFLK